MLSDLLRYQLFIDNKFRDAVGGKTFPSENPYTGQPWAEIPLGSPADIDAAVGAARAAFERGPWADMKVSDRAKLLRRLGDVIGAHAEELAVIETRDNGKIIREMLGQMRAMPGWYYYYAGMADKIQGDTIPVDVPNMLVYTRREPIGVVAAITPWNSPILLMALKIAPALAAGNTVVVKPSEFASASCLEFGRLVQEAGFPPGVFNVVTGFGDVGSALVSHPDVAKVAFTGSTETGKRVAQAAASHLAPVTLELGGKSPNIVFADADLDNAAMGVLQAIFGASGQTCMAGSRLFVQEEVHDALIERVVARTRTIKIGDPSDPTTEMGTVCNRQHLDKILGFIEVGVREGGRIACGGGRPSAPEWANGHFVEPTIFTGITNEMTIAREEIFGPVLSVIKFRTEEEVVAAANDTPYGLAAAVWTRDVQRAHRMANRLQAGMVWINNYRKCSYAAPFGGIKQSGYGRENGFEAIHDYTQVKTVWVDLGNKIQDPFLLM